MVKKILFILIFCSFSFGRHYKEVGLVNDWVEIPEQATHFKIYHSDTLNKDKWTGYPDAKYSWEGESLVWERQITDAEGNKRNVKTYKKPISIIANFKLQSKVYGIDGQIERAVAKKFGGSLKGFIWLDNASGGGEVTLPFTAKHIFIAKGSRLNPILSEISTDTSADNYFEILDGKTHVFVKSFSGIGGAAGAPSTLIAHYKLNDNLATAAIVDETGDHNGAVKDAGGTATSTFHSVAGKINRAQNLDGTDDYIEIADHDDFTPTLTPFSISAWVKMHDATNFIIANKGIFGAAGEWLFYTNSSDKLTFVEFDESAGAYIGRRYDTALTSYENTWIHLVATSDGTALSSGMRLHINGIRVDDTDYQSGTFVAVENLTTAVKLGSY